MTQDRRPLSLAVLIDADNASPRYAMAIFEEIARFGEANVRRIYGDFSSPHLAGWNEAVEALAILQHQQRNNTKGKNAADIALVIDAMDLMHKGRLDGVCLVSSDSDFTRLSQRLREEGLRVYGFGERKTPEAFRNACTQFVYVENLGEAAAEAAGSDDATPAPPGATDATPPASAGSRAAPAASPVPDAQTPCAAAASARAPVPAKEPASKAVPIIMKAMAGLADDDGWAALGGIGSRILMISPDFDTRTYGQAKLKDLVTRCGGFDVKSSGGAGWMIRPRKPKPKSPAG